MNDPNGTIFWKGRYHLFYQHNPRAALHGGRTGTIHWGHAVSEDLVHWSDLPIALAPAPGGPDRNGCYSGTAFVNRDGIPTIIYHGVPSGICIATSRDDMLLRWEKCAENPVIPAPAPRGEYKVDGAPCAWSEGDTYYAITGNSSREAFEGHEPDRAYLFRSNDLVHWEYMHPFYEGGRYTELSEDCAVPDFFPLGDKHVLLFASHVRGPQYYIGTYSRHRFIPERHGRLAYGETGLGCRPGILCECQTLLDGGGRRVLFGRLSEARYGYAQRASGWAGILALPMALSLSEEKDLLVEPIPELEVLRRDHEHIANVPIASGATVELDGVTGDRLEIAAVLEWEGAEEVGLKVRCAHGGAEETLIRLNTDPNQLGRKAAPTEGDLILDVTRSSESPDVSNRESQRCRLPLASGQPLALRVFVDRSVVEVFANCRQ